MSIEPATLYVVATPIGNLGDMTPRAVEVLRAVDRIAAEDTRHSAPLLHHFGIQAPMLPLHEHNERRVTADLVERLAAGEAVALISDAGTPLLSDPGYLLVRAAHQAGVAVVPVPGACAAVAALSAAGLPSDRFAFEGFPPAKRGTRQAWFAALTAERRTLIFYESPHRIAESLEDMVDAFGAEREAVLARELTKTFETLLAADLGALLRRVLDDADQRRGEIVVLVRGAPEPAADALPEEARRVADILAEELPHKQAAALAARISGAKKNALYQYLIGRG